MNWLCRLLLSVFITPCLIVNAAVSPTSPHYVQDALHRGQVLRWDDSARQIYVTIYSGKNVQGWKPEMVTLVKQAFKEWEIAMGGKVQFVYTSDPRKTDITVKWRVKGQGMEIGQQRILEEHGKKVFSNADIIISTYSPHNRAFTHGEIKFIALHEVGHALGIKGHSSNPKDIMFRSIDPHAHQKQPSQVRLSTRDKTTMRTLYKQKAAITNPKGIHLLQYQQSKYYIRLAQTNERKGNHRKALQYYKSAQKYYPKDPQINYFIGTSAYQAKQYGVAIQHLNTAVMQNNRTSLPAKFYLASSYMVQGGKEVQTGQTQRGMQKLERAKKHYTELANNPKASHEIRSKANQNLTLVTQQLNHVGSKLKASR